MWCLLFLVAGVIIGGTVVGLSVHFAKTTKKPAMKDHVFALTSLESKKVPMVIGLDGESVSPFYYFIN